MKEKLRKVKGITLIALVITIIVLLILAGVSIAILTGENGILTKTNDSILQTEIANVAERINLISYENRIAQDAQGEKVDTIEYLKDEEMLDNNNIINTKNLLGEETKYGKYEEGKTTDVYKIQNNEVVYINSNGEIITRIGISVVTAAYTDKDFVTTWEVEAGDELILPISLDEGNNNFIVDWGDGSPEETVNNEDTDLSTYPRHQYTKAGEYDIKISGKCSYFCAYILEADYGNNPEQLGKLIKLKSWGEIEAEKYEFSDFENLSGAIPSPSENTFKNFEDSMDYLFNGCKSIESIPEDLFSNIPDTIISFKDTFENCEKLTSIPENLFAKAVNVESFDGTFARCKSLTSIPENLFANNKKVTNFQDVFKECETLTSIPGNLFANNTEVTNFSYAFYRCKNIVSIPNNIFDKNQKVTNFEFTFYGLDFITTAPALWERAGVTGTSCFGSCDALEELIEQGSFTMPANWYQHEV